MLSAGNLKSLRYRARKILDHHWRGEYTRATERLYPHQWGWDAGWLAKGLSTYRPDRARRELLHLMGAQWDNGMVPHIVFSSETADQYSPGPDRWNSPVAESSPDHVWTSGIVQPPMQAWAALKVYERSSEPVATNFLKQIYPRLRAWHRYLYDHRDPDDECLVYLRHPWESGRDNCPAWDTCLSQIDLSKHELTPYRRKDLQHGVPARQRPTDRHYDYYLHLVDLFRALHYDEEAIRSHTKFQVQDPMFNAILVKSNQALATIARIVGADSTQPREWGEKTALAMRLKLWSRDSARFVFWDRVRDRPIDTPNISAFVPLLGGIPTDSQLTEMYHRLDSVGYCPIERKNGECWSVPTHNMHSEDFVSTNYWRGPVWGYTNRLIARGLRDCGFTGKAEVIEKDLFSLIMRHGFYEYYNPIEGDPLGIDPFPPTAAHLLDLLESHEYHGRDLINHPMIDHRGEDDTG